jgi:hypothetical protein
VLVNSHPDTKTNKAGTPLKAHPDTLSPMKEWTSLMLTSLSLLAVACGGDEPGAATATFGGGASDASTGGPATPIDETDGTGGATGTSGVDATSSSSGSPDESTSGGDETTTGSEDTDTDAETGTTGCGDVDPPDQDNEDENCDGIDGVLDSSVFVATPVNGGSDLNDGRSPDTPVSTLAQAISIAEQCDTPCDVLISTGVYNETVTVASGVSMFGGYDPGTWERETVANAVTIRGSEARTLIAEDLTARVEVDGVTIEGVDFIDQGQSSYAVWVSGVQDDLFELDFVRVVAGNGGAGADGSDGDPGATGASGMNASGISGGAGGTSSCGATGGDGGSAFDCGNTEAGDGSAGGDPVDGGGGGNQGTNTCGGCSDEAGNGSVGSVGGPGGSGAPADAATDSVGAFVNGLWMGTMGASGTRGFNGTGGGGGGPGGSDEDGFFCGNQTDEGGGGGGGGAGGCGGTEGSGGSPGGGSFGVVVIDSNIAITRTEIEVGSGGVGGAGGDGGDGGGGGGFGTGANGQEEGGDGRDGALGGNGGGASAGSGGCGGSAIGIALVSGGEAAQVDVSIIGGTGGVGGAGGEGGYQGGVALNPQAPSGEQGCTGQVADEQTF